MFVSPHSYKYSSRLYIQTSATQIGAQYTGTVLGLETVGAGEAGSTAAGCHCCLIPPSKWNCCWRIRHTPDRSIVRRTAVTRRPGVEVSIDDGGGDGVDIFSREGLRQAI